MRFISVIVTLLVLCGCGFNPKDNQPVVVPAKRPTVSPSALAVDKQVVEAGAAMDKMNTYIYNEQSPQFSPYRSVLIPLASAVTVELKEAKTASAANVQEAKAKDAEIVELRDALNRSNGRLSRTLNAYEKKSSVFQTTINRLILAVVILTAIVVAVCLWARTPLNITISVAVTGIGVIGFLWALGWIDAHKFLIFAVTACLALTWIVGETVWRKVKGNLSWGAAFWKAIATTPSQDLVDLRA